VEFAVLVKVVPASESATFDPVRKTIRRDEGELFVNPFDQRAIRVALDLRRPGESVTVVSMGPPATAPAVQETLGFGVDRAVLVSDPALAGSDSLVTARVLARVLTERPADLVLCGKWTTDSETGQVPAELAELLDRPLLSSARSLVRGAGSDEFEATVETETGSARGTFSAPAVVSVGEKIAKPAKRTDDGTVRPVPGRIERVDAAQLGFAPEEVGLLGSATVVGALVDEGRTRTPVLFESGSPSERAHSAMAVIRERLASSGPRRGSSEVTPRIGPTDGAALVLVSDENVRVQPPTLGVLTEIRRRLPGLTATAVLLGGPLSSTELAQLGGAGAERVVVLPSESPVTARNVAGAVSQLVAADAGIVTAMFPSTPFGREVAGRVAARAGLGLTGDAIGFSRGPSGDVRFVKPALGGATLAEIWSRTTPSLATVRPGGFAAATTGAPVDVPVTSGPALEPDPSVRWLARDADPDDGLPDPESARVVVSVGVGGTAALPEIRQAAARWGAALVGTRRVVDAGLLPVSRQVGLTGRWVAPELGILLGVRGSPNHLVAWRRARALLAVNPDRAAPVFDGVDVGIVGRCEEIVPLLLDEVSSLR
jgi:electron transfer flavoprotein alpha subunit